MKFSILGLFLCLSFCNNHKPDLEVIPDSTGSDTITIASWNMKNFGEAKFSDESRINIILDIITRFDIIALQEIQDADLSMPEDLIEKINSSTGRNYNVVASNRVGRGDRKEQYLFIYNDDIIDAIDQTWGYGEEPSDEFAREPFYCMFTWQSFDFYLFTIHTDPDDVEVEIPALKSAYQRFQENTLQEDDIILLGDFNACPPDCEFGSYIEMNAFSEIADIFFCINGETNTRGGSCYDNIIFEQNCTREFIGSGILKFEELYNLTNDQAFSISDHLPVWAKFVCTEDDD